MIRRLILHNFKSIASASVEFDKLTFLVGRNGSGKSNIADALAFLTESAEWPLQTVFNRRGGALNVVHRQSLPPRVLSGVHAELGIGIQFDDVLGLSSDFEQERVSGRYSFLLAIDKNGFEVLREQCIINRPSGKKVWFDRAKSETRSSLDVLNESRLPFILPDALAMPFAGSLPELTAALMVLRSIGIYSIDPGKLQEFQDPDEGKRLISNGSNAASVLRGLRSDSVEFRRFFEVLSTVIPDLARVRPQTIGRKQHLRFYQQWSETGRLGFDAFNMSDGTLRAFGILLALYQNNRPDLLLIEEPETSLHPAATAAIVETLIQESERLQIIISTHSPEVLDFAQSSEDNFKIVTWNKGRTNIGNVDGAAKASLQQHLATAGELFRMRILDAPPLFEKTIEDSQQTLFGEIE
jgi:predicted ATPase